jgi:hypothetical protein
MIFLKLRRKIYTLTHKLKGDGKNPARIDSPLVKDMTMFKATEKGKKLSRMVALRSNMNAKECSLVPKLIRIQLEEIKRKVGVCSPAALRFIGPGDHSANITQKGVKIAI